MSRDSRSDAILCVLYARALQRKNEGFPSTTEEIAAFKAAHPISAVDAARFRVLAQRMVDVALAEADNSFQARTLAKRQLTATGEAQSLLIKEDHGRQDKASFRLRYVPRAEAHAFVRCHHRHLPRIVGEIVCVGAERQGKLVAVATIGRPVARRLDDGYTAEITRLASDGTRNVCSWLYSRAKRAAQALGFIRVVTYTRDDEPGSSLLAIGAKPEAKVAVAQWTRLTRPRTANEEIGKTRWVL